MNGCSGRLRSAASAAAALLCLLGPAAAAQPEQRSALDLAAARLAAAARFAALADYSAPREAEDLNAPAFLLESAERGSPALALARGGAAAAAADLAAAKGRRFPTLSAESSASYLGNPLGPITVKRGQLGSVENPLLPEGPILIPPEETKIYKGMEATLYRFTLAGELPLYTWGKIRRGIDAAAAALAASRTAEEKARHELRYRIAGLYSALAYASEAERVLALQGEAGRRLSSLAEANEKAGFMTRSEALSVKVKAKEIDIGRAMAAEKKERLTADLAALAGLDAEEARALEPSPAPAAAPERSLERALAELPRKNLDLAYGKSLVEARRSLSRLAAVEASGKPDLGLRLEWSYGSPRFPLVETDWYGQGDYQFTFSLGTTGKLFGNPVMAGEAARAAAELVQAEASLAEAERSLRSFIRERYLKLELLRARIEYAALLQEVRSEELERQGRLLQAGAGSETEYLTLLAESLGDLASAYGLLGEYRAALLELEAAGS